MCRTNKINRKHKKFKNQKSFNTTYRISKNSHTHYTSTHIAYGLMNKKKEHIVLEAREVYNMARNEIYSSN